jgi:hypothetical protein
MLIDRFPRKKPDEMGCWKANKHQTKARSDPTFSTPELPSGYRAPTVAGDNMLLGVR